MMPNQAHSVDAPIARFFHLMHHWRRATDARRWATMRIIALCVILAACRLCFGAVDTNVIIMSDWSKPVSLRNDRLHDASIRGRLLILQGTEPAYGGPPTTNSAMTFVELQNVTGAGGVDIDVYFDVINKLKFGLVDRAGKAVPLPGGGWGGGSPSVPCWVKLYYNSTVRLYVSPGTLAPLTIYPGGHPGRYWSVVGTDTNTYFLSGTLTLSTHTNLSVPPEARHGVATVEFPKVTIKPGIHQNSK